MEIVQGNIYWFPLDSPEEDITHHHMVIQDNVLNHSRINTVVVCALTTNIKRANSPGNILLETGEANFPKQSVVVVSRISTVDKTQLGEFIGTLSQKRIDQVLAGMQFLQKITKRREIDEKK